MTRAALLAFLLLATACDGDPEPADAGGGMDAATGSDAGPDATTPDGGGDVDAGDRDAGTAPPDVAARARALAEHLRGHAHFMMGLGNDLDGAPTFDPDRSGAFTLGTTLDLHYAYLVGYGDMGGWPTWNTDGGFVTIHAEAARRNGGVAPMFTYYQLALDYETGGDTLTDAARLGQWLTDVELLFTRLGDFGDPAVVHLEPDLFGYLQQRMEGMSTTPDAYPMELSGRCADLPHVASSFGACMARMRDELAPEVRVGLSASQWAAWYDVTDPGADVEGSARSHAAFLAAMGGDALDLIVVETLDRDAGFWEAYGGETGRCSVTDGPRGPVYWDETNATLPNFATHLTWVGALTEALGLPALWWQTPLGVPGDACGGSDGMWRDNRVRYFFSHVDELIAAGGAGATFGTGAGRQTYITSDGDQFRDAVGAYFASPTPLP